MDAQRWSIGLLLLGLLAPGVQAAGTSTAQNEEGAPRFLAGFGVAVEGSNLDDWAQSGTTGVRYEYASGGTAGDLYTGVEVLRWFSFRLGYHHFGEQEANLYTASGYAGDLFLEGSGNFLALDALYPLTNNTQLGLTLGTLSWSTEAEARYLDGSVARRRDTGRDGFAGLRGRWLIEEGRGAFTVFFNRYRLDTDDTDEDLIFNDIGLGLELRL